MNLALSALGGRNTLRKSYRTLSPKSINRILSELEPNMSGRVNENVGLIINTLGTERNRRAKNINAMLLGLAVSAPKKTTYKRPSKVRTTKKKGLANMSSLLKAIPPKFKK